MFLTSPPICPSFLSYRIRQTLAVILFLFCYPQDGFTSPDIDQQRADAVKIARNGDISTSIRMLETYLKAYPENIALKSDLIVVYGWNGDHKKAIELYNRHPKDIYPEYVLNSLIAGYRQQGKSQQALIFISTLPEKLAATPAILTKKIQLLVDIGEYEEAEKILEEVLSGTHNKEDALKVAGYLNTASENWIGALGNYQKLLAITPTDQEALRGQFDSLLHLGAPHAASLHPENSEDIRTTVANMQTKAALLLRWSSHASKNREESIAYTSEAKALLEKAISLTETAPEAAQLTRGILYDLVIAETNLQRYEESYALFTELAETGSVPTYVTRAAAEALLGLHRPDDSLALLNSLPSDIPKDYQTELTLFYALIESEHFKEAYDLIDVRLQNTPKFKTFTDSSVQYRNDERLDLEIVASQARLYGDQLAEAFNRINELQNQAPGNDWLNHVKGETYLSRGLPRNAHTFFNTAYGLNPDNNDALAAMAQSDIALHRLELAQKKLEYLQIYDQNERSTIQLGKDLKNAERANLWADLELSYAEGPEQSGDGIKATTELISSPINHLFHLSLQGQYAWSELLEGEESRTTYGAGVEYIGEDLSLLTQLQYNDSTVNEMGGVLRTNWSPDDHWSLGLQAERFSEATPLRALYYGIREDRVLASTSYRWHESRALYASFGSGWFTDDNKRLEGNVRFNQRVIDIPRFDIDLGLDLYGSTNSRDDAPYFNPVSDFSGKTIITAEHIIYRAYETSVGQKFTGSLGMYAQENYSTGATGSVGYELRFNHYPYIETVLGAELGQNRYDGEDEPYYKFTLLIHARF